MNRDLLRRADWGGMLLFGSSLMMLYIAIDQGNRLDWLESGIVVPLLAGGGVLLVAFLVNEALVAEPWANVSVILSHNVVLTLTTGALLETFVFAELLKLASLADDRFQFSHFRDKDGNEVDVVIEDRQDRVVGIEVKAFATVTGSDFGGLRKLLHDDEQTVPFGPRLVAEPLSTLWA